MRSEPLMRVGAGFGMIRYSSASSTGMHVKTKLQKDRKMGHDMNRLQDRS